MSKTLLLAIAASGGLLLAAPAALADGSVLSFKKDSIPAMGDDRSRITLSSGDVVFPADVIDKDPGRKLVAISHNGAKIWLREADINAEDLIAVESKPCLGGEIKVAMADAQLGATQMGSGGHCTPDPE